MFAAPRTRRPTKFASLRRAVVAGAALTYAALLPATAAAAPPLPVPYGMQAARIALAHYSDLESAPPGANDWTCRPSAAHPEPVILLHGYTASQAGNWQTLAPLLANNGYCVFSLNYGLDPALGAAARTPGAASVRTSATRDLAPFVDRVLAATGAARVDFVGHSMGTVVPRYYIKFLGGAAKVSTSVNITPLNNGTDIAGLANATALAEKYGVAEQFDRLALSMGSTPGGNDLVRGSDLMDELNSGVAYAPGIDYTFLLTRYDELVTPFTSGLGPDLPNVTNIVVQDQCPSAVFEHVMAASNPVVAQNVLNALDPEHSTPIDCAATPGAD